MEIKLAQAGDLNGLKAMYREIAENMAENGIKIWDSVYPAEFIAGDIEKNRLYLILNGGEPAAAFALCESAPAGAALWKEGERALYIERLGVNVKYLRKGFGLLSLKAAAEKAKEKGAKYLRLFAAAKNEPAIKLYEKSGFKKAAGVLDEKIDEKLTVREYGFELEI